MREIKPPLSLLCAPFRRGDKVNSRAWLDQNGEMRTNVWWRIERCYRDGDQWKVDILGNWHNNSHSELNTDIDKLVLMERGGD